MTAVETVTVCVSEEVLICSCSLGKEVTQIGLSIII
jgi:hypothetical protein